MLSPILNPVPTDSNELSSHYILTLTYKYIEEESHRAMVQVLNIGARVLAIEALQ